MHLALGALLAVATAARLIVARGRPLWLDEVWTGMIAGQTSLGGFLKQCYDDINAPLFYTVDALWAQWAGLSDFALRAPALLFGIAAPLLALAPARLIDRATRFTWCALLACWPSGVLFASEARYYTLYFLLGCANAIAFSALMLVSGKREAWTWSILSSLFILSHYFALVLIAIQFLIYVTLRQGRARRQVLALAAFLPPFLMLLLHASRLVYAATPGTSWIPLLGLRDLARFASFTLGSPVLLVCVAVWLAVCAYCFGRRKAWPTRLTPEDRALAAAVIAAMAAMGLVLAVGFLVPVVIQRYVTGFIPAILLGLALVARHVAGLWRWAPLCLIAPYALAMADTARRPSADMNAFNFVAAADDLILHRIDHLVFMWDNPLQRGDLGPRDNSALAGVGGFFFARAGHPVTVDLIRPDLRPLAHFDPNLALTQAARGGRTGILWIYDLGVAGTSAIGHPPRIEALDPRWRCVNDASGRYGAVACSLRAPMVE